MANSFNNFEMSPYPSFRATNHDLEDQSCIMATFFTINLDWARQGGKENNQNKCNQPY